MRDHSGDPAIEEDSEPSRMVGAAVGMIGYPVHRHCRFLYLTSHAARVTAKKMSRHARVKREEAKQGCRSTMSV